MNTVMEVRGFLEGSEAVPVTGLVCSEEVPGSKFQRDAIPGGQEIVPMVSVPGHFRNEAHVVAIRWPCGPVPCPILNEFPVDFGDHLIPQGRSVAERSFELKLAADAIARPGGGESAKRMPLLA